MCLAFGSADWLAGLAVGKLVIFGRGVDGSWGRVTAVGCPLDTGIKDKETQSISDKLSFYRFIFVPHIQKFDTVNFVTSSNSDRSWAKFNSVL